MLRRCYIDIQMPQKYLASELKEDCRKKNGPKQKLRKGIKDKVNTESIECKGYKNISQQV